ncbi:hypothetical protein HPB48_002753 [Haemaphysalis longicornis]|uniref:Uncharacterized protein n=1 Tax=Haemaphysalis longicornis TaxID=44386 RepID=A0A9J6GRK3_HAELO|nr:hypothetical protein HPB48_002753 [Haemaphysalis longicornis]
MSVPSAATTTLKCEFSHEQKWYVQSQVPEWVSGKLFRLGPGKWELGEGFSLRHWFDGAAILSAYEIHKGKVLYSSRFLASEAYKKMSTVNRPVVTEFGTRCYPGPLQEYIL